MLRCPSFHYSVDQDRSHVFGHSDLTDWSWPSSDRPGIIRFCVYWNTSDKPSKAKATLKATNASHQSSVICWIQFNIYLIINKFNPTLNHKNQPYPLTQLIQYWIAKFTHSLNSIQYWITKIIHSKQFNIETRKSLTRFNLISNFKSFFRWIQHWIALIHYNQFNVESQNSLTRFNSILDHTNHSFDIKFKKFDDKLNKHYVATLACMTPASLRAFITTWVHVCFKRFPVCHVAGRGACNCPPGIHSPPGRIHNFSVYTMLS